MQQYEQMWDLYQLQSVLGAHAEHPKRGQHFAGRRRRRRRRWGGDLGPVVPRQRTSNNELVLVVGHARLERQREPLLLESAAVQRRPHHRSVACRHRGQEQFHTQGASAALHQRRLAASHRRRHWRRQEWRAAQNWPRKRVARQRRRQLEHFVVGLFVRRVEFNVIAGGALRV